MIRRVVITGMGGATTFGENQQAVSVRLLVYKNAARKMPEWQVYDELHTLLGVPIDDFTLPEHYTHKRTRTMGRVSLMSIRTTELAFGQAELVGDRVLINGETGIIYDSSTDSTDPMSEFATILTEKRTNNTIGTTYVQMMPRTTVVNTGLSFSLRGRAIPISSTYTSGNQAVGYVWEAIRYGYQAVMIAGSAEELYPFEAAVLDTLFTTSQCNDEPKTTPSPFDEKRDGLAIREGAGTLVLEELEYIKARGATIYDEIVGFATDYDAAHITQSQRETIQTYMEKSLNIVGISIRDISYISAHGATADHDGIAESQAISAIYSDNVPLSSLKSYFRHTPGAYGILETQMSLQMMREGWLTPTLNLSQPDASYGTLDYIMGEAHKIGCEFLQGNNLALGGIDTSIIIKRWL